MSDQIQNSEPSAARQPRAEAGQFRIQNFPDPVALALAEDIGSRDLTCEYFVDAVRGGKARIFAKEPCVLAGVDCAVRAFALVDATLDVRGVRRDGDTLQPGDTAIEISGPVRGILTAERTALNFIQQLSGVATLTRKFVDAVKPHRARILDTRKTTPGLRALEKAAVLAGGGTNHRLGLFDMVMVKDNHLAAGTTLAQLAENVRRFRAEHPGVRVEIEADRLDQVRDFLTLDGVDVILLDNMTTAQLAEAVQLRDGKNRAVLLEASGGVTLATVNAIAATGVDFISVGALTHSAPAVDFSLELTET
ncbi:MAG: carboxylating nicotinate-nucleotide diphosphorylase [Verrucomicrobiota bacterium]